MFLLLVGSLIIYPGHVDGAKYSSSLKLDDNGLSDLLNDLTLPNQRLNNEDFRVRNARSHHGGRPRYYAKPRNPPRPKHNPLFNG